VEGVRALPAGHLALVRDGRAALEPYWSLRSAFDLAPERLPDQPVAVRLRELLCESVRLRLVSDVPVAVFLSGGLDSSAVTALAAQQSSRRIRTFSVIFEEAGFSEHEYISRLVERYDCEHASICLTGADLRSALPEAVDAMDQPTFDGINTFVVAREARRAGLKVALSGVGGDELFGGYASFGRLPALRRLRRWVPAPARPALAWTAVTALPDTDRTRKLRRCLTGDEPVPEVIVRELFSPEDRADLLPGVVGRPQPWHDLLDGLDDFNRVSYYETHHYLRNVLLRDTDGMSMAHGLEVREPLLDHRLVEFATSLDGPTKRGRGSHLKPLLAAAVMDDLPAAITGRREKMGFVLPFARWLGRELRAEVEATLLDPRRGGAIADVLDPAAVAGVWRRFQRGEAAWVRPWALYVLKEWGERHR
jgi:asparagine synthase (glutamine-hydrolysing)